MTKKNKKKKGKKRLKVFLLLFIVIIIIFGIIVLLCAYVFDVKTKAVIIHGNNYVTDNEILEQANIEDYPNFILANTIKISNEIEKNNFIKDAKVRKNLFFQINIYIEENKPLFIREDTNKIVFDANNEIDNEGNKNLNIPYLINYVPNTKYEELIKKIKKLDYKLVQKISQIKYEPTKYDEDRFIFYMNDSNRVYINLPKMKSFNKYDEMVTKFEGKTGKLFLDGGNYFEIDKKKK